MHWGNQMFQKCSFGSCKLDYYIQVLTCDPYSPKTVSSLMKDASLLNFLHLHFVAKNHGYKVRALIPDYRVDI